MFERTYETNTLMQMSLVITNLLQITKNVLFNYNITIVGTKEKNQNRYTQRHANNKRPPCEKLYHCLRLA